MRGKSYDEIGMWRVNNERDVEKENDACQSVACEREKHEPKTLKENDRVL